MKDFSPVFVGGFMRSGTTLLRTLLDRHPRLSLANETYFMNAFAAWPREKRGDHAVLLKAWWDVPRCAAQGLDPEALKRRFDSYPADEMHLFRAALEEYAAQRGKDRSGEKTPDNDELRPGLLLEWYPQARIVFIVRDPRGAYASILKVPFGFKDPSTMGARWANEVRRARALARRFPERARLVRYEDLVEDPKLHLSSLMPWLGLEFSPVQLDAAVATPAFLDSEKPYMALASRPVQAARADAWREELDPVAAARVALAAGPEMKKCGYVAGPSCLSLAQRFKGRVNRAFQGLILGTLLRPLARGVKRLCVRMGFNPDPWHEPNRWVFPDPPAPKE